MIFRPAHLLCLLGLAAHAAPACGVASATAEIAAASEREIVLVEGQHVRLAGVAISPSAGAALRALIGARVGVAYLSPAADRWGRRLVDLVGPDGGSVALDLVLRGLARVDPEAESRACDAERFEAESAARAAEEGDWGRPDFVLAATDAPKLAQADGRFVLVSGTVRRVGQSRAKVYLDFAGRGGFSVLVSRKAESRFRRSGVDLTALAGRKVLVRGVLDDRFGPRIEVADPSLIEPLESVKETGRGG